MSNVDEKTLGFIDLCIKKIMLHLDETNNSTKLQEFNNFFVQDPSVLKIIYNTVPYNDSVKFITDYYNIGPPTAHSIESFDFHLIPGLNNIVVSVSCKCKYDESGNDKQGNNINMMGQTGTPKRALLSSAFGVFLQIIIDGNKLIQQQALANTIMAFNYNIVYKPTDSLVTV